MVDKVPSFKDGGALWFTDLTATDSLYIFPILTALTFWITVEVSHHSIFLYLLYLSLYNQFCLL